MFMSEDGLRILTIVSLRSPASIDAVVVTYEDGLKERFAEYTRIDKKETTVAGERAIEITFNVRSKADSPIFRHNTILMMKDGKHYAIMSRTTPSDYDLANQKYFEPMIQSFTIHKRTPLDVIREVCPCF